MIASLIRMIASLITYAAAVRRWIASCLTASLIRMIASLI
jgi:hypothetical protein